MLLFFILLHPSIYPSVTGERDTWIACTHSTRDYNVRILQTNKSDRLLDMSSMSSMRLKTWKNCFQFEQDKEEEKVELNIVWSAYSLLHLSHRVFFLMDKNEVVSVADVLRIDTGVKRWMRNHGHLESYFNEKGINFVRWESPGDFEIIVYGSKFGYGEWWMVGFKLIFGIL